jgi:hypothetical protein
MESDSMDASTSTANASTAPPNAYHDNHKYAPSVNTREFDWDTQDPSLYAHLPTEIPCHELFDMPSSSTTPLQLVKALGITPYEEGIKHNNPTVAFSDACVTSNMPWMGICLTLPADVRSISFKGDFTPSYNKETFRQIHLIFREAYNEKKYENGSDFIRRFCLVPIEVCTPNFFVWFFGPSGLNVPDLEDYMIPTMTTGITVFTIYRYMLVTLGVDINSLRPQFEKTITEIRPHIKLVMDKNKDIIDKFLRFVANYERTQTKTKEQIDTYNAGLEQIVPELDIILRLASGHFAKFAFAQIKILEKAVFDHLNLPIELREMLGMSPSVNTQHIGGHTINLLVSELIALQNQCHQYANSQVSSPDDNFKYFSIMQYVMGDFFVMLFRLQTPKKYDLFTTYVTSYAYKSPSHPTPEASSSTTPNPAM